MRGGTNYTNNRGEIDTRFQSARPVRGGTLKLSPLTFITGISIRPPRAGRDIDEQVFVLVSVISISPPRAGRDSVVEPQMILPSISIRPPRAGRDRSSLSVRIR